MAFESSRRVMLQAAAAGFGQLALTGMSNGNEARAESELKMPHHRPRAKRVIFLFMHGGPSQVDTFDYKPQLDRDHGKPVPFAKPRVQSSATANLLKSPFKFQQYGESGAWVSELFPHVARQVDDLCIINSMHCSNSRHGGALLELHTGSDTFVRPSMGSWIQYGLGTENENLPGYISICPTMTHGGANAFGSAFLPARYQGTAIGNSSISSDQAVVPFIDSADAIDSQSQRREIDFTQRLNQRHRDRATATDPLDARIESLELAFRMQSTIPGIQDVDDEPKWIHEMYGMDDEATRNFGRQCLMARRFIEQGVRFVQCTHSYKWDQHGNLKEEHSRNGREVDKPIAGLLTDLKQRGLLEDTIVLWGGEFGRTPVAQGDNGRDHNSQGYTMWAAGGGFQKGLVYGATDEYGYYAAEQKVHVHDLHATILHLLGIDHTRLTYRYAGRDFRLTDIYGEVVRGILA